MQPFSTSALGVALLVSVAAGAATPPTIEEFAARPRIEDVTISPDGRYLAVIQTVHGRAAAVVVDRTAPASSDTKVVMGEPDHFRMSGCRWATNTRLICSFLGMARDNVVYSVTRLAAVDADGAHEMTLVQGSEVAQGQYHSIINWHPGPKDTVLVAADEGLSEAQIHTNAQVYGNVGTHGLPAVFELNVVTGRMSMRQHARDPIRAWITDKHGQVRLGWGVSGTTVSYIARLDGQSEWRRLVKFEVFTHDAHFDPIAISGEDPNKAYAYGPYEGRTALWLIDLTDKEDPSLIFSHPLVDVGRPVLDRDARLLAVPYDPAYPMMYFTDPHTAEVTQTIAERQPGKFTSIFESSLDENVFVLRTFSDLEPPSFRVFDATKKALISLGAPYPDRDVSTLATMRSISYAARDGTRIPAYLSTPPGVPAANLPLIVMPHGGPIARDTWGYFFLRQFLVSRGYAVLQMNFRGSGGYGENWFFSAHQDWGGLTYDDVIDGARWAIEKKIADPRRVGIVGWSFGGYIALLAAQRNPDLFRCSVDIAGPSDLGMLIEEGHQYLTGGDIIKRQIGTDTAKLKLNSPRMHAAEFNVPLLMLQGGMDAQVPAEQSADMDSALKRAGKAHRLVTFRDADHSFSSEKDRAGLLREIEGFLLEHLTAGTAP